MKKLLLAGVMLMPMSSFAASPQSEMHKLHHDIHHFFHPNDTSKEALNKRLEQECPCFKRLPGDYGDYVITSKNEKSEPKRVLPPNPTHVDYNHHDDGNPVVKHDDDWFGDDDETPNPAKTNDVKSDHSPGPYEADNDDIF